MEDEQKLQRKLQNQMNSFKVCKSGVKVIMRKMIMANLLQSQRKKRVFKEYINDDDEGIRIKIEDNNVAKSCCNQSR